jgi:hypothetical protein
MKIAIDLDKTYEADPHFFDGLASRFHNAGHKVGILSARAESEGAQIHFLADFVIFLDIGEMSYADRGVIKATAMKEHGIDLLFDDRANYIPESVVALKIV